MRGTLTKRMRGETAARSAWLAFGGLLALAAIVMTMRELPSIQREIKLMRM